MTSTLLRYLKTHPYTVHVLFLLVLLVLLFPVTNVRFTSDSMGYINKGTQVAESFQYSDTTRGPGMAVITAMGIRVFGRSVTMLVVLVRVAYVVSVFAFAALTWRLYGFLAGWPAVLYFAFSPLLHWPATRFHVDIFLVAGALLALWVLYESYQRQNVWWGAVSGILLGLSFLIKETAMFLFPLWAVAWVLFPSDGNKSRKIGMVSFLAAIATILPWLLILQAFAGDAALALGDQVNETGTFQAFFGDTLTGPISFVSVVLAHFFGFFSHYFLGLSNSVAGMGAYGWIVTIALPLLVLRAIVRRKSEDIFVLIGFALYAPLMVYLSWTGYDARQAVLIFGISALAVAAVIAEANDLLSRRSIRHYWGKLNPGLFVAILFVVISAVAAAATPSFHGRFSGSSHAHTFYLPGRPTFESSAALSPNFVNAVDWIASRSGREATVMAAHRRSSHYLEFALKRKVVYSPIKKHNILPWVGGTGADMSERPATRGQTIYIQPNRAPTGLRQCISDSEKPKGPRFCKIYYLREDDLLETIRASGAEYFIVTPRFRYFEAYLEQNPSFVKLRDFGTPTPRPGDGNLRDLVSVYAIEDVEPVPGSLQTAVNYSFARSLEAFEEQKPERYQRWKEEVLFGLFGLSDQQLASILARETPCFQKHMGDRAFLRCLD